MSNSQYVIMMARYNLWQNENIVGAADKLTDAERRQDRGAFFGSIHGTLSHLLWGDQIWMSRFSDFPTPISSIATSTSLFDDWQDLKTQRSSTDQYILDWAHKVPQEWFEGDLSWRSDALGHDVSKPKNMLSVHLFNHQTHHRGQVHAMLTSCGKKTGDTDIPFMPNRYESI